MNRLQENVEKIHASEMAAQRLRANLDLIRTNPVTWVREVVMRPDVKIRKTGKKWYVETGNAIVTIYDDTFAILTAQKKKPDLDSYVEVLEQEFYICKVEDFSLVDQERPFTFVARTDQEYSVVCPADAIPENTLEKNGPWRCYRAKETLDLEMIGCLTEMTRILSGAKISVFCNSTYNTDYIFVPGDCWDKTVQLLNAHRYL